MKVAAIFAGGVGSRMNLKSLPKQFLEIYGKPVIVHTLERFQMHPEIDAIAVAILPEYKDYLRNLVVQYHLDKVRWIVEGGATGQESRHKVLTEISRHVSEESVVLLHDGVRPLIDDDLISENLAAVKEHGAAVTCTKVNETIVESEGNGVGDVLPREALWTAQAPQTFKLGQILGAYERAIAEGRYDTIDSLSLMRDAGHYVHRIEGPTTNIKITTTTDYYVCRAYFSLIEDRQLDEVVQG